MAAGLSWLVDKNRIATKIKSASACSDPRQVVWQSNPTRHCPSCHHLIDNSDEVDDWPGLPRGVKFDPSDPEIIWHLLAKTGLSGLSSHPFIDEFIPTVNEDDGICYTHPKNLPGVKEDGTVSHFFHRAIKAYSTGTRKRRKIHDDDFGDVRWHKTGKTKPVVLDGVQRGCKKIMVLYCGKAVKTNWVMHQYHLGTDEDEKEGEFVVSKIFYQQPQQQAVIKQGDKAEEEVSEDTFAAMNPKADLVTPKLLTPGPPHAARLCSDSHFTNDCSTSHNYGTAQETSEAVHMEDEVQGIQRNHERPSSEDEPEPDLEHGVESRANEMLDDKEDKGKGKEDENGKEDKEDENQAEGDLNWLDSESQLILDSQQLVEALSLCDDLLQMGSQDREGNTNSGGSRNKQPFADYAHLGTEDFKRDLEECQKIVLDPLNIELDTPPEFRLSQLEFGSQDSFLAWGTGKKD